MQTLTQVKVTAILARICEECLVRLAYLAIQNAGFSKVTFEVVSELQSQSAIKTL